MNLLTVRWKGCVQIGGPNVSQEPLYMEEGGRREVERQQCERDSV